MAATLSTRDVEDVDTFLSKAAECVFRQKDLKRFDGVWFAIGVWQPSERISIWLGCHTTDSVRREWDTKVDRIRKTSVRIARMVQYLEHVRPELRTSKRAEGLLQSRFAILEIHLAEFHSFWAALKKSLNIDTDSQVDRDGLFDEGRRLIWGGIQFTLTTNQALVFRLLVDAYPGDVLHDTFEDKGVRVLRDSFRFKNAQGKKQNYPCWDLIVGGSVKDSKRLIDPSIVRSNPKKFSNPQHNPQDSPR